MRRGGKSTHAKLLANINSAYLFFLSHDRQLTFPRSITWPGLDGWLFFICCPVVVGPYVHICLRVYSLKRAAHLVVCDCCSRGCASNLIY